MQNNKQPVLGVEVNKYRQDDTALGSDLVVCEEPLEIRLKFFDGLEYLEKRLAVTMRTPGNDFELVVGFLISEGIIEAYDDIDKLFYCTEIKSEEEDGNVVIVVLQKDLVVDRSIFERNFYVSSSCGVCGKSSIESVKTNCKLKLQLAHPQVDPKLIRDIPTIALGSQTLFKHTGGLHASALFEASGELILLREDIGRHNALDKIIGARAISKKTNESCVLFASGRIGFELVQKAVMAGIPIIMGVGASSSLAIELAKEHDLTLIGFARKGEFNVYNDCGRIYSAS